MNSTVDTQERHAEAVSATARHDGAAPAARWFAARIASGEAIITKQLSIDGIHCYRTKYALGILFLRCTMAYASEMISSFYGRIFFYLEQRRRTPDRGPLSFSHDGATVDI